MAGARWIYRSRSRITPEDPSENDLSASSRGEKKGRKKQGRKSNGKSSGEIGAIRDSGGGGKTDDETKSYGRRIFDSRGKGGEEFARLHANFRFHALRLVLVDPLFPNSIRFSVSSGIKSVSVLKKWGPDSSPSANKSFIDSKVYFSKGEKGKKSREGKCIKKKKVKTAKKEKNV